MVSFHVVIPARHASTRLHGKPLLQIAGKPMVVRVAEQAAQSGAQQIWIATDHHAIANVAHEHGFKACMTKDIHTSGTDRIAEVVAQHGWPDDTIVVNVQGDEPLMPPALIRAVAEHLHNHPECAIATACHAIHDEASLRNPNIVKTVLDQHGNALYFSRAPIPYPRDAFAQTPLAPTITASPLQNTNANLTAPEHFSLPFKGRAGEGMGLDSTDDTNPIFLEPTPTLTFPLKGKEPEQASLPADFPALRHIGIYAYRASFLRAFGQLAPTPIEHFEALEQLRALYYGYKIGVVIADDAPPSGVDTEQDLHVARQIFATKNKSEE